MTAALRKHWPEYLMEAFGLGVFMLSACLFCALLEHPVSPVRQAIADATLRRVLMGLAMGSTAAAIVYSPWGQQSGAHINPAVTLTFFRLGKIGGWDALFYAAAQFAGALAGVLLSALLLGAVIAHPTVAYVATLPGPGGPGVAFAAEVAISFGMMLMVLGVSNSGAGRYTGVCAAALVATYIAVEAPISGMSMNPARTLGSALPAGSFQALWIYFVAPPLGMLLAAETYRLARGSHAVACCKLHHANPRRCIHCEERGNPACAGQAATA